MESPKTSNFQSKKSKSGNIVEIHRLFTLLIRQLFNRSNTTKLFKKKGI